MFIVESYPLAVFFCIITMLCWGSWANTQKMTHSGWPFQLFYWDYSFGILLITLFIALTLGSFGESGRSFLNDLMQADRYYVGQAFLGGVLFNLANLLLVIAIQLAGMSVAFPVGIGLALVLGVISNFDPAQQGNATALWLGVMCIVVAIVLDALAYRLLPAQGTSRSYKGIIFSILAGIMMGFFYQYVANALVSDFSQPESGKLSPYTALVIFASGIVLSNLVFNVANMYRPVSGTPTTFSHYFKKGNSKQHLIGLAGGAIWGVGMSFNLLASEVAGPALAYGLGQGATMVAAIWGVFVWKEFEKLPSDRVFIVYSMFTCFAVGIALLVYSK